MEKPWSEATTFVYFEVYYLPSPRNGVTQRKGRVKLGKRSYPQIKAGGVDKSKKLRVSKLSGGPNVSNNGIIRLNLSHYWGKPKIISKN